MQSTLRPQHSVTLALLACSLGWLETSPAAATPAGFVKSTIPLDAPPVALTFGAEGVLYALEGAEFLTNEATLRTIAADGTFGASFSVVGDDPDNFFVGGMTFDSGDPNNPNDSRLLITDNTADGRLYTVSTTGSKQTLATGIAGIASVAVRSTGEIFVSAAPFGSPGSVLQVDRNTGATSEVLGGLELGAGLAFDTAGDLIVQEAYFNSSSQLRGRLQRLPITETSGGLLFGTAVPLIDDMESSFSLAVDSEGDIFSTGGGGLFSVAGSPLAETSFLPAEFAAAIGFDPGLAPFEAFAGPEGGRLALAAEAAFGMEDMFVTLLTPARTGDYNGNGTVDDGDYLTWQSTFGSTEERFADGNRNGFVDAADYVLWRKSMATSLLGAAATSRTLPEPATSVPGGFTLMALAVWRRRRPNVPAA